MFFFFVSRHLESAFINLQFLRWSGQPVSSNHMLGSEEIFYGYFFFFLSQDLLGFRALSSDVVVATLKTRVTSTLSLPSFLSRAFESGGGRRRNNVSRICQRQMARNKYACSATSLRIGGMRTETSKIGMQVLMATTVTLFTQLWLVRRFARQFWLRPINPSISLNPPGTGERWICMPSFEIVFMILPARDKLLSHT